MTALIVARPLVLGEDPGLLAPLTSTSGMVLSLLWLMGAAGWAVWRFWSGQGWRGSWVEVGLAATVGGVVLSAGVAAAYKHPAWLLSWEWFLLLVVFCLVRQLARAPGDNRGLLAACLATGVTVSGYAVYQYTVEFPSARAALRDRASLRNELAQQNIYLDPESNPALPEDAVGVLGVMPGAGFPGSLPWGPLVLSRQPLSAEDETRLARWEERIRMQNVFATFSHPNSFAGFLALLVPAALGLAAVSRLPSTKSGSLLSALAVGCAVLIGLGLWLTHSRGAILGVLVAGGLVAALLGWSILRAYKLWIGVVALAVVALGVWAWQSGLAGTAFGKDTSTSARRLEYWGNTWAMITDHPWLGVGAGGFGRYYPRYMPATAFEKLQDPHNFILEMWATSGIFTALALLATLAVLFWQVGRNVYRAWAERAEGPGTTPLNPGQRWEFYLGGVVGLLIGFVLRASHLHPDFILVEGMLAGGRSVIWFVSFAVFDSILWRGPARALVLAAGVLALLINLLVSGGIALPSVAQPLWIMAALALNTAGVGETRLAGVSPDGRGWFWRFLPLPGLIGIWLVYVVFTFGPITNAYDQVGRARQHYLEWRDLREPYWRMQFLKAEKEEARNRQSLRAAEFLEPRILHRLDAAVKEDPENSAWYLERSHWRGELWKLFSRNPKLMKDALDDAEDACRLDPANKQGYLAKVRLHQHFAQTATDLGSPGVAPNWYGQAAKTMADVIACDPNDARLHYQLAELLFRQAAGQPLASTIVAARKAAGTAQELDEQAADPGRRLTDRQRRQVQRWLRTPSGK